MATVSKEYLVSCLKAGFTTTQISESLGVTASAVHQVIDAHNLMDIAGQNSKFQAVDDLWNTLEDKALVQMHKTVQFLTDPMKLARIAQVANAAKRRSLAEGQTIVNNNKLVQLNLPEHMQVKVELNARNQVVSVEGKELLTLQSAKLLETTAGRGGKRGLESKDGGTTPKAIAELL